MQDTYFLKTNNREWLLTNNIGGYALGTGNLINQRKYHGLLISAHKKGARFSLLSGLEIMIEWRGETFHIDSTNYSDCIYPEGFLHLVKSWLRPYPSFLYSSLHHNNDILILMELIMVRGENSILIKFSNLGRHKLHFHIRPKLTMRNHHYTNKPGCWNEEEVIKVIKNNSFSITRVINDLSLTGSVSNGTVSDDNIIYYNCYYPWEAIRGYHGVEDLVSPCKIYFDLQVRKTNNLFFKAGNDCSDTSVYSVNNGIDNQIKHEKKYKLRMPQDIPVAGETGEVEILSKLDYENEPLFDYQSYFKILELSLKDFILEDDLIAGYPWFGSWGRDTFISLEALVNYLTSLDIKTAEDEILKATSTIWNIFTKYGSLIKHGLLPNVLPESGREGNYESIDSCLWYVIRINQFIDKLQTIAQSAANPFTSKLWNTSEECPDPQLRRINKALAYCRRIINGLLSNTTYPYSISKVDGLLYLHDEFAAATWMDAKIDGKAVTPRNGAPVEINALFYNALCSFLDLLDKSLLTSTSLSLKKEIQAEKKFIKQKADRVKKSFAAFWNGNYLADRIENNQPVKEYRPNAVIAVSLPYEMINKKQLRALLHTAKQHLLTDYGLRTLAPQDYRFQRKYLGNQKERDKQYHQGTVWPFLLDFYAKSYVSAYQNNKSNSELASELESMITVLRKEIIKGHAASVAEVFDGHNPNVPKGCPAQAWSVAALYNIEITITKLKNQ